MGCNTTKNNLIKSNEKEKVGNTKNQNKENNDIKNSMFNFNAKSNISNENQNIDKNPGHIKPEDYIQKQQFTAFSSKYKRLEFTLGKGAFGTVEKVEHIYTKDVRAMKTIVRKKFEKNVEKEKNFIQEVDILLKLDNPNILKIFDFYYDDKNYYIITEYLRGGELFDKILQVGFFSEKMAANIIKQLLSGVNYLHKQGIVHRDLKPENILLESNNKNDLFIKIIDFGTSIFMKDSEILMETTGTVSYYIILTN